MYDPSLHQHCIVSRKGYFFSTKFVDGSGDPLPLEVMESKLQRIVQLADEAEARGDAPMLGWLSSNDRDSWADARDELLKAGGAKMEAALEKLQSGALLLCLDDEVSVSFIYFLLCFSLVFFMYSVCLLSLRTMVLIGMLFLIGSGFEEAVRRSLLDRWSY